MMIFVGLVFGSGKAGADNSKNTELFKNAQALFQQHRDEQVITMLAGPATDTPWDFELNNLYAKALLNQCVAYKKRNDTIYRDLVRRPYEIGVRLAKNSPGRPGPYYIIARSLLINERPQKAMANIQKAVQLTGSFHQDWYLYMEALGDCWSAKIGSDSKARGEARKAYKAALASNRGDHEFQKSIKQKLKKLNMKKKRKIK